MWALLLFLLISCGIDGVPGINGVPGSNEGELTIVDVTDRSNWLILGKPHSGYMETSASCVRWAFIHSKSDDVGNLGEFVVRFNDKRSYHRTPSFSECSDESGLVELYFKDSSGREWSLSEVRRTSLLQKSEEKVNEIALTVSEVLSETNWVVLDKTEWERNITTEKYCVSWNFIHPEKTKLPSLGEFVLMSGEVEQKEDNFFYDCSSSLKTYKVFFIEQSTGERHLISTITRVAEAPVAKPTVTPEEKPTTVAKYGTFVIKMRVGTASSVSRTTTSIKTYTYNNIWIQGSLDNLGEGHTRLLEKSGSTYTYDLTQTDRNCQTIQDVFRGELYSCGAVCYRTVGNQILSTAFIPSSQWGVDTCKFYSDRAQDF